MPRHPPRKMGGCVGLTLECDARPSLGLPPDAQVVQVSRFGEATCYLVADANAQAPLCGRPDRHPGRGTPRCSALWDMTGEGGIVTTIRNLRPLPMFPVPLPRLSDDIYRFRRCSRPRKQWAGWALCWKRALARAARTTSLPRNMWSILFESWGPPDPVGKPGHGLDEERDGQRRHAKQQRQPADPGAATALLRSMAPRDQSHGVGVKPGGKNMGSGGRCGSGVLCARAGCTRSGKHTLGPP